MQVCRMTKIKNNFSSYLRNLHTHKHLLIADSACDQMLITNIWTIIHRSNSFVTMTGAFAGRNEGETFPVVSAKCVVSDAKNNMFIAVAHDALYDENPHQTESLLSIHQSLRNRENAIDDRSIEEMDVHGNSGTQSSKFGSFVLSFEFDGRKCYYKVIKYDEAKHSSLPTITISGEGSGSTTSRIHSRMTTAREEDDIAVWQRRFGLFLSAGVVRRTLEATTQYVPSLRSEPREIMRDHLKSRTPELKLRRINDKMCVDTFFSSIKSILGYNCWNLHSYDESQLNLVVLQQQRSQSLSSLKSCFNKAGVPHTVHSDNATEFTSAKWKNYLSNMK